MKNTLCCIFNYGPHYRFSIYKLLDSKFKCDFYFGDKVDKEIKSFDYKSLNGYKGILQNIKIYKNLYWQIGSISLIFSSHKNYLITGEIYCISTWIILIIAKILKKNIYIWGHGWYGKETQIKKIIKKIYYSLPNKIFLYGDYARELMIKEGIKENKLICIYNSLNYEKQIIVRRNLKKSNIYIDYFNNKYPVLIYIGRLQKIKKLELLLECLEKLHNNNNICNLIIIGNNIDNENIYSSVNNNIKRYVWFYGPCYDENKIGELIYNADLCISPGNVGLTAIHSFTYGTPVVTHNNFKNQMPEFEIIKKGITGDFFEENSIDDLYIKIKKWIWLSKNERENIRYNCYLEIESKYNPNYQIKTIVKNIRNVKSK